MPRKKRRSGGKLYSGLKAFGLKSQRNVDDFRLTVLTGNKKSGRRNNRFFIEKACLLFFLAAWDFCPHPLRLGSVKIRISPNFKCFLGQQFICGRGALKIAGSFSGRGKL